MNKSHFLFVPALAVQREAPKDGQCLLGSWVLWPGNNTSCNNLKEGAEWICAQGWGSGVHREEIPGQPLCQEKSCEQPQDSFGTGLVRDLNVWLWAQHSWLAPDPGFQWDTPKLSPSVPWKWLSIHLHTTQPQGGFTLDSEVKAVGHFQVHYFAISSFFPEDKILLREKRKIKITSDLSFTSFSLLELITPTLPFCPWISKCFTKATNIADSTLQWGKQEHKGEGYLFENPSRDQQQR